MASYWNRYTSVKSLTGAFDTLRAKPNSLWSTLAQTELPDIYVIDAEEHSRYFCTIAALGKKLKMSWELIRKQFREKKPGQGKCWKIPLCQFLYPDNSSEVTCAILDELVQQRINKDQSRLGQLIAEGSEEAFRKEVNKKVRKHSVAS